MSAGGSAHQWAAETRAHARRGVWRKALSWVGVTAHTRRADAVAARRDVGAAAEARTAALLAELEGRGWHIRHDLALPRSRANLDHVLVSPCGGAVVVLDTKRWHAQRPTRMVGGRVHCGGEDRHEQVEDVAGYARRVARALAMPGVVVWPLLVVHGSAIQGGRLEARAPDWDGVVHVLGPSWLVPTLAAAPPWPDPVRAEALTARVDAVLRPYGGGGGGGA